MKSGLFAKTLRNIVRSQMPLQSMLNAAEEITYLHHGAFNPLLDRFALDLMQFTRYFQRD